MKKMVCEICESQKIKKENGVFICQDCGTEYSLEEAKKLLIDIYVTKDYFDSTNKLNVNEEQFLKEKLSLWAEILKNIELCRFYYSFYENDNELLWKLNSLNDIIELKSNGKYINLYDVVKSSYIDGHFILFYIDHLIDDCKQKILKYPTEQEYSNKLKLLEKLNTDIDVILSRNFTTQILQKKIESKFMFDEAKMLDLSNFPVCKDSGGYIWKAYGYVNSVFYPDKKFSLHDYSLFLRNLYKVDPKIYIYKKKLFNIGAQEVEYKTNINLLAIKNKVECFFNDITCQYNIFYKKVMIPIFEESREILLETISLAEKLNKEFIFPLKYRKVDVVLKMLDLLESGNASTWKELVNAYDTYEYRESVKLSFEVLNQKFDKVTNCLQNINNNLINVNDKLLSINNELSSISLKCSKIISNTERIKNSTFAILWEQL